jgi:hypothetical protein
MYFHVDESKFGHIGNNFLGYQTSDTKIINILQHFLLDTKLEVRYY